MKETQQQIKQMLKNWKIIIKLSVIIAVVACMGASAFITALEWFENPNSIFHSKSGTNWKFVTDTFFSWFAPLLLLVFPISIVLSIIWYWVKQQRYGKQ